MLTWSLAIRNLLRNRRRSLSTLLALAIGAAAIMLFGGYFANIKYSMQTGFVRSGGHLQIQHRDYFLFGSANPISYAIEDYVELTSLLRNDKTLSKQISIITPILQFGGVAGIFSDDVSRTAIGLGVVASDVDKMRQWNQHQIPIPGIPFVLNGAANDAALIGVGLARVLKLCARLNIEYCPSPVEKAQAQGEVLPSDIASLIADEGSKQPVAKHNEIQMQMLATNANGTTNVGEFRVVKAEGQGLKEFDDVAVLLQLKAAQQLLFGKSRPKVTALVIQIHRTDQLDSVKKRLTEVLTKYPSKQPLSLLDLETLNPQYVQTNQLFDVIYLFIFTLIGSIVLFSVSNTMQTAVAERTVEIGTLRAMGLRQNGIRILFVTEGFLLGVAGTAAGTVAGLLIASAINASGITWLPPGAALRMPLHIQTFSELGIILSTSLALIILATAAAWWPAFRAARMNVVESLRHA